MPPTATTVITAAIGACMMLLMSSASGVRGLPADVATASASASDAKSSVDGARTAQTQHAEIAVSAEHALPGERSQGDGHSESTTNDNGRLSFKLPLLLPAPAKTAESVNLEHEAIPSKILSLYDNSQLKVKDISHPIPILDTIGEVEKYGNSGDMFDGISRAIVNGYEAFSNLLNTAIQKPKELARSISRGITAQLDVIGGKLVGL